MGSGPATVEVAAVTHRYPGAPADALSEVSISIEAGRRVGLLGPNGAGKSTLMRLVCGYLPVQAGTVTVSGLDVRTASLAVRRRVGYMPEHVPLYPELRVGEHLRFRARLKGVRPVTAEVMRVTERTGLGHMVDVPVGHLSRGYRQRVGIADALVGAPALVILDEPTVGLDPNQVQDIRALLRDLAGEQTLVFSSHILAEVEVLCDDVVILAEGRVVAAETIERATSGRAVEAAWTAELSEAQRVVAAVAAGHPLRASWTEPHSRVRLWSNAGDAEDLAAAVGRESVVAGLALTHLAVGRDRLEARFARVTGSFPGEEQDP